MIASWGQWLRGTRRGTRRGRAWSYPRDKWKRRWVKFDEGLYNKFRKSVSELNADEAKDEERGRELASDKWDEDVVNEFSNLHLQDIKDTSQW